jgi:hypothetical protein
MVTKTAAQKAPSNKRPRSTSNLHRFEPAKLDSLFVVLGEMEFFGNGQETAKMT